ncbi:MAG: T9SS type A sorting domain-containing protein [Bacteroidales bacterium]|jgi:hypothetical protein|nr:T9SS type A sorting domain-containing protein [Bacteroidales bacterium]
MKKITVAIMVLCLCSWGVSAQITQNDANAIAVQYAHTEIGQSARLYRNATAPTNDGVTITTSRNEMFRARYACWTYFVNEPSQRRYIFVKASDGTVLEVIAKNDESSNSNWQLLSGEVGVDIQNKAALYPNPVSDVVNLPCSESTKVEIRDLQGNTVFAEQITGQVSLSFLKSGVYTILACGKNYKIVKQ